MTTERSLSGDLYYDDTCSKAYLLLASFFLTYTVVGYSHALRCCEFLSLDAPGCIPHPVAPVYGAHYLPFADVISPSGAAVISTFVSARLDRESLDEVGLCAGRLPRRRCPQTVSDTSLVCIRSRLPCPTTLHAARYP